MIWDTIKDVWDSGKEVFFTVGSLAGGFAFLRPYFDKRNDRDLERARRIIDLVCPARVAGLADSIYGSRYVYSESFDPFDQLRHERRTQQDGVRFTGPMAKHFNRELGEMLNAYEQLREYIQVSAWEPKTWEDADGAKARVWDFNKQAFAGSDGIPRNYTAHLDEAHDVAVEIRKALSRFQLVSELHVYEIPLASLLLRWRNRRHGLRAEEVKKSPPKAAATSG